MKDKLLAEAVRIGDGLLDIAGSDETGMYWNLMAVEKDGSVTAGQLPHLFNGVCGVVVFFLELYRQTENQTYLDAAVQGMRWVENHDNRNPSDFYGFLNGRMGTAYTLLRMHQTTGEARYLQKAVDIAAGSSAFFNDSRLVSYWVNGASGTVTALLHLHAASQDHRLLEPIDRFVKYLIEAARPGPKGLYWDRSSKNISGLCGFVNGAAGIGFAFLELGRYFSNGAFYWIAEQAFVYETCFYDPEVNNWRDLRRVFRKYEDYRKHEAALLAGDMDFFKSSGRDVNTWGHGAAGIGLSRLRAYELLSKPQYETDARRAIEKTVETDIHTHRETPLFTLNEGGGGNAELFLKAAAVLDDPAFLKHAETIAANALDYRETHDDYLSSMLYKGREGNTSLFSGNPGIGYFLLRVLDPVNTPSIPAPEINAPAFGPPGGNLTHLSISQGEIKKKTLNHYFKRSIAVGETLFARELDCFFERDELSETSETAEVSPLKNRFAAFLETGAAGLPEVKRAPMVDAFALEMEKKQLDEACAGFHLLYIRERVRRREVEAWRASGFGGLMDTELVLAPNVRLHECQWRWDPGESEEAWLKNLEKPPDQEFVLFRASSEAVSEVFLSPFAYVTFGSFRERSTLKSAFPGILGAFGELSEDQERGIRENIIAQVKEAILSGILLNI